jgi:uncharacterized spore protein YtfJ
MRISEDGGVELDVREFVSQARSSMSARRVYAKPYKQDGVTVIPAARVSGGAGGGGGEGPEGQGSGGGFGVSARPVGAYVIRDGDVRWKPAIDLVQLGAIALLMLLAVRSIVKILTRP